MDKTFAAIEKLKEVELELHRLKNYAELMNRSVEAKKEWVGLTNDEQLEAIWESGKDGLTGDRYDVALAIEAKLKEKNT